MTDVGSEIEVVVDRLGARRDHPRRIVGQLVVCRPFGYLHIDSVIRTGIWPFILVEGAGFEPASQAPFSTIASACALPIKLPFFGAVGEKCEFSFRVLPIKLPS